MALTRAAAPIATAQPVIDGYRVLDEPQSGNSSTLVYRAVRLTDEVPVLLKILRNAYATPLERAGFQWEYELLRGLNIPGVVHAYDLRSYEGRPVMVLEDFGGHSLAELLSTRPLALVEALECATQLAGTLDRLHRVGILHCSVESVERRVGERRPDGLDRLQPCDRPIGPAAGPAPGRGHVGTARLHVAGADRTDEPLGE